LHQRIHEIWVIDTFLLIIQLSTTIMIPVVEFNWHYGINSRSL